MDSWKSWSWKQSQLLSFARLASNWSLVKNFNFFFFCYFECKFNFMLFRLIVADNFGIATYAIFLFLLTVWWSQVWGDSTACPYNHMEDMVEGKTTPRDVALKTWAQLMGGCCVWRFVQFFWWLELAQTHKGKAFEDCSADLQVNNLDKLCDEFYCKQSRAILVSRFLFSFSFHF